MFVEIRLDRTVHDVMDTFNAAVQLRPEILQPNLVAGVRKTRTCAVMEEVKNSSLLRVWCPGQWLTPPVPCNHALAWAADKGLARWKPWP